MSKYIISLIAAVIPTFFVLLLIFQPALLAEHRMLVGVVISFISYHYALKYILDSHTQHVIALIVYAGLFTFYKTFNDGGGFLYPILAINSLVLILIILMYPLKNENK